MCPPAASEPAAPDGDHQRVPPTKADLEADYQRKVAAGRLHLADITADGALRASYERIARHHMKLANAELTNIGS